MPNEAGSSFTSSFFCFLSYFRQRYYYFRACFNYWSPDDLLQAGTAEGIIYAARRPAAVWRLVKPKDPASGLALHMAVCAGQIPGERSGSGKGSGAIHPSE